MTPLSWYQSEVLDFKECIIFDLELVGVQNEMDMIMLISLQIIGLQLVDLKCNKDQIQYIKTLLRKRLKEVKIEIEILGWMDEVLKSILEIIQAKVEVLERH